MATEVKRFIVGEKVPDWFIEQMRIGRAKQNFDDDMELESIQVYSATKTYEAHEGDMIMLLKSGMSVVPKDKVQKYGLQRKDRMEEL